MLLVFLLAHPVCTILFELWAEIITCVDHYHTELWISLDNRKTSSRRGGDWNGGLQSSESATVVDEDRKSKRRTTTARPVAVSRSTAARHSVGAGSTRLPVNRGRPVIPVCMKSHEAESFRPAAQQGRPYSRLFWYVSTSPCVAMHLEAHLEFEKGMIGRVPT